MERHGKQHFGSEDIENNKCWHNGNSGNIHYYEIKQIGICY